MPFLSAWCDRRLYSSLMRRQEGGRPPNERRTDGPVKKGGVTDHVLQREEADDPFSFPH